MANFLLDPLLSLSDENPFHPPDPYRLGPRRRKFLLQFALLLILVVAAFWPSLGGGPLWQDAARITTNVSLRTWPGVARLWMHPNAQPLYTPMAATFLAAEHRSWHADLPRYRAVSFLLHLINVLLLWKILRRLNVRVAWLAAAVFAVHPICLQAVAWVSQQGTLLATTFALAAMLACLRWQRVEPPPPEDSLWMPPDWRGWLYPVALIFFTAAVLSHPMVVAMPPAMLLVLRWRGREMRANIQWLLPFFAIAAGVVGLEFCLAPIGRGSSMLDELRLFFPAMFFLTGKTLWPMPLHFVYPKWNLHVADPLPYLLAVTVAAGMVIGWMRRRQGEGSYVVAMIYVIAIAVGVGFGMREWLPYSYAADYFEYFAGMALITAVLAAIFGLIEKRLAGDAARSLRFILGLFFLAVLSTLTWRAATAYSSETALWQAEIAKGNAGTVAHDRLGMILLAEGKTAEASDHFKAALALDATDLDANAGLSRCLETEGRLEEAAEQYNAAIQANPQQPLFYTALAGIYATQHKTDLAIETYQRAIAIAPGDESAHNNLGLLLVETGQIGPAIWQYQEALKTNPDSVAVRLNLANALFRQGDLDQAAGQLQEVVRIDPFNFEAFMNSGAMLGQLREFDKAEQMFRAAVRVRGDSAEAFNNLGLSLAAQGKFNDAAFNFQRAVDLKQGYEEARQNLIKAKERAAAAGQNADAVVGGPSTNP